MQGRVPVEIAARVFGKSSVWGRGWGRGGGVAGADVSAVGKGRRAHGGRSDSEEGYYEGRRVGSSARRK